MKQKEDIKNTSVVSTADTSFADIQSAFDARYAYLAKEILLKYETLLSDPHNWKFGSFVASILEVFEKEKKLSENGIGEPQLIHSKSAQLFQAILAMMAEVTNYLEKKGEYRYQVYNPDRIIIDHEALTISILPENLPSLPYIGSKKQKVSKGDEQFLKDLFDTHSEDTYWDTKFGKVPRTRWHTKITKDNFDRLLEIIGKNKNLVVEPKNMELGFKFGFMIYKWKRSLFRGLEDTKECLFWVSENHFPDEYTGKQVFDELVMNEWNIVHLRKYLDINIAEVSFSRYRY